MGSGQKDTYQTIDPSSESKHNHMIINTSSSSQQHMYRKYARSLRRSTQPPANESILIRQSLNANRSLPPLREQPPGGGPPATQSDSGNSAALINTSYQASGAQTSQNTRIKHMKKSMVKRAALGHIKRSDQSVDGGDGSYEMIRVTSTSPDHKQ